MPMPNPEAEPPRMRKRHLSKKEASSKQQNKTISPAKTPKTMWQFLGYRNTIGKKLQGMIFQCIINPCSSMTWLCRDLLGSQRIPAPIPSSCTWPWWYVKWTHLFSHYLVMVLKVLERCSKIYRIVILDALAKTYWGSPSHNHSQCACRTCTNFGISQCSILDNIWRLPRSTTHSVIENQRISQHKHGQHILKTCN